MVTVNKRVGLPQAITINGIDTGGAMTARIDAGFDNVMRSAPDGLEVPIKDKETEYVRGSITTQDWAQVIAVLTGVLGTYIFYERKSGVAVTTGFIKHTITNPVIHRANFRLTKGGYGVATFDFECRAEDETKGLADMWTVLDEQAAPAYITAARGGFRIVSAKHGHELPTPLWQDIYHVTDFDFTLTLQLVKECNDSDLGYTCVDARLDGLTAEGSISFQDSTIVAAVLVCQTLLAAIPDSLVLSVKQGAGGAAKTVTIANVDFNNVGRTPDANRPFTEHAANFDVANDAALPLTLEGANKIITII